MKRYKYLLLLIGGWFFVSEQAFSQEKLATNFKVLPIQAGGELHCLLEMDSLEGLFNASVFQDINCNFECQLWLSLQKLKVRRVRVWAYSNDLSSTILSAKHRRLLRQAFRKIDFVLHCKIPQHVRSVKTTWVGGLNNGDFKFL